MFRKKCRHRGGDENFFLEPEKFSVDIAIVLWESLTMQSFDQNGFLENSNRKPKLLETTESKEY